MKKLLFTFFFLMLVANVFGATRYWVPGGDGAWTGINNWSTSSGGGSGASAPTSNDDVVFDTNSGTPTVQYETHPTKVKSVTISTGGLVTFNPTVNNPLIIRTALTFSEDGGKLRTTGTNYGRGFQLGEGGAFTLTGHSASNCFVPSTATNIVINTTSAVTIYEDNATTAFGNVAPTRGQVTLGNDFNTRRILFGTTNNSQGLILGENATLTISGGNGYTAPTATEFNAIDASAAGSKVVITNNSASFLNASTVNLFKPSTTVNSLEFNRSANTLKINQTLNFNNLIVTSGTVNTVNNADIHEKLTIASGATLTASGNLTLKSSVAGTATLINSGTLTVTGTTSMEQYLSSGRQWWYLSSPLSGATSNVISPEASNHKMGDYNESTASFSAPFTAGSATPLTVGKGYVVKFADTDARTITFTGGSLNNSQVNYTLTRTLAAEVKRGFHLIGNPYPSYIDWDAAYRDETNPASNMRNSIWIRTWNGSAMVFNTYADLEAVPLGTNGKIAPMQAFWVKVHADPVSPATVSNGTLTFKNTHRSHKAETGYNPLKVKAADTRQRLRMSISNGTAQDEMLIVGKSYASNGLDAYDIEKMTNSSTAIPEIYSLVQNEELVINSMNELSAGSVVAVGMRPGQSGSFTMQVTQFENINVDVYLVDHLTNTETELTAGTQYTFTSDATTTNERFSVEFRSPEISTAVTEPSAANIFVFVNDANQISVHSAAGKGTHIRVYNMAGQQLATQLVNGNVTLIDQPFNAGVYLVKVNNYLQKVVIK